MLIVAFVALASGFGQDLITPVLPAYLAMLGVSRAGIGLADGLLQGSTSIFRFVSGILSDRYHDRKWFIFFGYALSSVTRPLLALVAVFPGIALLRTIDGVGKGMKDAPRDALIADSTPRESSGRSFGFHRLVDTLGSVIGPSVAAAVLIGLGASLASYRLIFGLAVIPGAVALALILFGVREPEHQAPKKERTGKKLPATFWLFTVGLTIAMFSKINDSLFLVRAQSLGISAADIPLLFGGFTLLYALLSYPIGIWSDRIGKTRLITAGWLLLAVVEFGFSFAPTLPLTLLLFAFYGLFYALTEGSARAFIADMVQTESRGAAYAIYYTFTGLAVIVGGFLLGHLWDTVSPTIAFQIASAGSVLGAAVLSAVSRRSALST